MAGFDTARSLWSWTAVDGVEGGRAAAILKMHHSLDDGIGGMQLATELFDLASDAPEPDDAPAAPAPESPSRAGVLLEALGYDVRRVREVTRWVISATPGHAGASPGLELRRARHTAR